MFRIKAGIDVSNNMAQLYSQTERFIGSIAKRYASYEDMDDLKQEGYLALYDAVDGYDPDTGNKFLTFARWHIMQRIQRYIQDKGTCLRIPVHKQEMLQQYKKIRNQYLMKLGKEPTIRDIAYHLDLSMEQAEDIKERAKVSTLGSLDVPIINQDGAEDITVGDMVADSVIPQDEVIDQVQQKQLKIVLWGCVDSLEGRQPDIIRKRYIENKTLNEIAEDYGVTRELIRQNEAKALRELRKPKVSKYLMPYFEDIRSSAMLGVGAERFRQIWTSATEYTVFKLLEGRIK